MHCYYIRTLYKTIAIRAAFCYLCLTSSCSGNTLNLQPNVPVVSLGILLVFLNSGNCKCFFPRDSFFSRQTETQFLNEKR